MKKEGFLFCVFVVPLHFSQLAELAWLNVSFSHAGLAFNFRSKMNEPANNITLEKTPHTYTQLKTLSIPFLFEPH